MFLSHWVCGWVSYCHAPVAGCATAPFPLPPGGGLSAAPTEAAPPAFFQLALYLFRLGAAHPLRLCGPSAICSRLPSGPSDQWPLTHTSLSPVTLGSLHLFFKTPYQRLLLKLFFEVFLTRSQNGASIIVDSLSCSVGEPCALGSSHHLANICRVPSMPKAQCWGHRCE